MGNTWSKVKAAFGFSIDSSSIPPEVFGLEAYPLATPLAARIDRRSAIQVPAVKRGRDLICGPLSGLPLVMLDPDMAKVPFTLFEQPERDVPRSVTMAKTFDDLLFESIAWWRITEFHPKGHEFAGFPKHVVRLEPRTVDVRFESKVFVTKKGHNGTRGVEWVPDAELIRFDSPNDPLLVAGARAIRTALNLDAAAADAADGTPPQEIFTPKAGEPDVPDPTKFLTDYRDARRISKTAYVPAALDHKITSWSPKDLQLADARQHAVLELARLMGIDPEDVGVSVTSRTYQNSEHRRHDLIDITLAGYLIAVRDRLNINDVTPPGYRSKFNVAAFVRGDTKTRYEGYEIGLRIGAITGPEIRDEEERPPLTDAERPAAPAPQESNVVPLAADRSPVLEFDSGPALTMSAEGARTFAVDYEARTITGLAVPYGVPAKNKGKWWQFSQGSLDYSDPSRVKLWIMHDVATAVGRGLEFDDRPDGLHVVMKVAKGTAGDHALAMADPEGDGVWDGFSIGLAEGGTYKNVRGVNHAIKAPLMEISLTPAPVFDTARVHAVAASAATTTKGETNMRMTRAQRARLAELHALTDRTAEQETELTSLVALAAADDSEDGTDAGESGSGDAATITAAVAAGMTQASQQFAREVVSAARPVVTQAEAPYRFGRGVGQGEHEFSTDIIHALRDGNGEAHERVLTFMQEHFPAEAPRFAIATTDVNELNPTVNRPDMYVDQLDYTTPLYDSFYKGALADSTPFNFPKFATASGLVGDHTQGTEPTAGAFTTDGQTVTPTALSGKAEINREVWDAGGNPQVSTLIWNEMLRAWREGMEAYTEDILAAVTAGSGGAPAAFALTAGATDDDLVNELERYIATLQFRRGGNRFTKFHGHADLYLNLVDAADADGRKLLPQIGGTNTNGQAAPLFASLRVGGQALDPAWALGASGSVSAKSYLTNPADVHVWNSAPNRLTFEHQVKSVDIAIWGYKAGAVSRAAGVQVVTYDPVA